MTKIQLVTARREFVAWVSIPDFVALPEVLMWGVRFFTRVAPAPIPVYAEVFGYAVRDRFSVLDHSKIADEQSGKA